MVPASRRSQPFPCDNRKTSLTRPGNSSPRFRSSLTLARARQSLSAWMSAWPYRSELSSMKGIWYVRVRYFHRRYPRTGEAFSPSYTRIPRE